MITKPMTFFFALTLFVSAWLLFAVQPLLGKLMLPLVGGSPNGWLTAVAFFQLALLAGYLLAHLLSRLDARRQLIATIIVLGLGTLSLPPDFALTNDNGAENVSKVLLLLVRAIMLPYVGLAMVSSGLQRLYVARDGENKTDPYFLYAASNTGSLLGLLSYPLIVESFLPLSAQQWLWSAGYIILMVMLLICAWPKLKTTTPIAPISATALPTQSSWLQRGYWVLLAFIPSSLSMGLTALVMADIGSMPLLWVIPLALYLVTFIMAFASNQRFNLGRLANIITALFVVQITIFIGNRGTYAPDWIYTTIPLLLFFFAALWCHARLAAARPAPQELTGYYLWLAVGGALGGCFNAFIAPLIFSYPIEFILTATVALALQPWRQGKVFPTWLGWVLAIFMAVNVLGIYLQTAPDTFAPSWSFLLLFFLPVALWYFPRSLALASLVAILLMQTNLVQYNRLFLARNFFGIAEVVEGKDSTGQLWRVYRHGRGAHGAEMLVDGKPQITDMMYINSIRPLLNNLQKPQIGIVGSGVAMALCLHPQQQSTIYEIDPLARYIAEEWFHYIQQCGQPAWRMGDGRLELQRDTTARYDLLILDAFAGGFIPTHLLTKEALSVYRSRLTENGVLAINTNNLTFYNIDHPVQALAQDSNLQVWAYNRQETIANNQRMAQANWLVLAKPTMDLSYLAPLGWRQLTDHTDFPIWRDDFTNIMAALAILRR